jgi:hypothetical protein
LNDICEHNNTSQQAAAENPVPLIYQDLFVFGIPVRAKHHNV